MPSEGYFFMHWTQKQLLPSVPSFRSFTALFTCFRMPVFNLCFKWCAESALKRFRTRPLLRLPLYAVYFPSERSITCHGVITQRNESKPSTGLKLPFSLSVPLLLLSICSEHRSRFPRIEERPLVLHATVTNHDTQKGHPLRAFSVSSLWCPSAISD